MGSIYRKQGLIRGVSVRGDVDAGLGEMGKSPKLGLHLNLVEFVAGIECNGRRDEEDRSGVVCRDFGKPHWVFVCSVIESYPYFLARNRLRNRRFKCYFFQFSVGCCVNIGACSRDIGPIFRGIGAGAQRYVIFFYRRSCFTRELIDARNTGRWASIGGCISQDGSVIKKPDEKNGVQNNGVDDQHEEK